MSTIQKHSQISKDPKQGKKKAELKLKQAEVPKTRQETLNKIGYFGYVNLVTRSPQTKALSLVPDTIRTLTETLCKDLREVQVVTIIYLKVPNSKRMISEELEELPSAEASGTQRMKLYEWKDALVIAKFFSN